MTQVSRGKKEAESTINRELQRSAHRLELQRENRTSKTGLLEARPFYVLTVEEGLDELKSLTTTCVTVKGQSVLHNVCRRREKVQRLLDAAQVSLPKKIADRGVRVSTRKKLVDERQPVCAS